MKFFSFVILFLLLSSNPNPVFAENIKASVSIKGSIANSKELGDNIHQNTYLQLVLLTETNGLLFITRSNGENIAYPGFSIGHIKDDGSFDINNDLISLCSGKYIIYLQNYPVHLNAPPEKTFKTALHHKKKLIILEAKKETKSIKMDLGETIIPSTAYLSSPDN